MSMALVLAAATALFAPVEPLAGQLRAAIWKDIEANGIIGNGNEVARLWLNYYGRDETASTLSVLDLACQGGQQAQRCSFTLFRAGGPIVEGGRSIGDRINCTARFRLMKADRAWEIPHLPPIPTGGHSRTIMKCEWAAQTGMSQPMSDR